MQPKDTTIQGDNFEESIGDWVNRVSRVFAHCLNRRFAVAGIDVTVEQMKILRQLWCHDGQCQQVLADGLCKDKASLTRLVDALERRNLIVRVPHQLDRRQKLIYLTNRGKAIQVDLVELTRTAIIEVERDIDEAEALVCKRVLNTIYRNITGTG